MIIIGGKIVNSITIGGKEVKTIANATGYFYAKAGAHPSTFSGARIMHMDGSVYTQADWTSGGFSASEAVGVAIGDGTTATGHQFCLAKKYMLNTASVPCQFTPSNTYLIPGMTTTTTYATAITDFAGKANTQAVLDAIAGGYLTKSNVAAYCTAIYSPWGDPGYIPASGQMKLMYDNATDINTLMAVIGGDTFVTTSSEYYWCSTQYNANVVWGKGGNMNVQLNKGASGNAYKALAIFDY